MAWAQQPCTPDARRVVDELYRHMLERGADPGSATWVNRLQSGTTVREIVREIAKSTEHAQRFYNPGEGAVAHERAVATLYRHILGRQPDPGGLRTYTQTAMNQGLGAVVDSIVSSREYDQNFGDWGVPGSGGIRYCGPGASTSSNREMRFPQLDTNRDGVVSRSEWRGSDSAFRVRDWNRDGVLSGEEVRMGAYPPDDSLEAQDFRMTPEDRFDYLDANNDGRITENEWDGSLDTFDRLERNRDGRLSRVQLGSVRPPTPFASIDTNRDGRITLGEWPWSRRTFIQQDENSDGAITRGEYRGAPEER
jgi:Ca2+-binding EF-hand superfamily protein